jgi:DNA-binding NarL/FixJ family response regulator
MLSIAIITDEPLLDAGIKAVLDDPAEFNLSGSFHEPRELQASAGQMHPDVILYALDGERDPSLADLRHAFPVSMIVLMSRDFSPEYAHQALELGVRGFISRTTEPGALKNCILKAGHGELWMESSLSMMLLETRPVRLSKRQSELIYLLAQGLKNKEIAGILGISEGTVKAYLTALFEKMGAKDRFELALFGLKHLKDLSRQPILDKTNARTPRAFVPRRVEKLILT